MHKIGIIFDHDITIRNFLDTDAFGGLLKRYNVDLIFPKKHKRVSKEYNGKIPYHLIDIDLSRAHKIRLLYHFQSIHNLKKRKNFKDRNQKKKNLIKILGYKKFYLINFFSYLGLFPILKFFFNSLLIKKNYRLFEFFEKQNYTHLIHPTVLEGLFIYDLITYKKITPKTKIIFLMNSWDNPSNKALIDGYPDFIGVWGEQTKNHCSELLNIPEKNISIIGSPQLSMYKNFYKKNTDSNKKILCFAGSSLGLNETSHLEIIDRIILNYNLNIEVIFKPHPWKTFHPEENFFEEKNFKNIKIDRFSEENYKYRFKNDKINLDLIKNDNTLKTLEKIDCLITPLSTIMLESAMCGIPFALYVPEKKNECKSLFYGQENNLIYQEFITNMNPIMFSDITSYHEIILQLIKNVENEIYKKKLSLNSSYFCSLSNSYNKSIETLINV